MLDESLFEYYGMHLDGEIVSNAEPDIAPDPDQPDGEY